MAFYPLNEIPFLIEIQRKTFEISSIVARNLIRWCDYALYILGKLPWNYMETEKVSQVFPSYELTSMHSGAATSRLWRRQLAAHCGHRFLVYSERPTELFPKYL